MENCENFDEGVTRVAPKEEFNLSEKRKRLRRDCQDFTTNTILDLVEQQDKEFVKRLLTPNNISKGFVEVSTIKYYAGDKLNGNN